jgi:hypothetical protein
MSEVALTLRDAQRAIHGQAHGSVAESVIAALSAEPETIEELEAAVARFIKPTDDRGPFAAFRAGLCEEPWDAGIVVIDLAARLVAAESTYLSPSREGQVRYHDGSAATEVAIHYRVPDDWMFIHHVESWQPLAERRRAETMALPPLDTRAMLYDQVTEFIVKECLDARAAGVEDPIADIHARWLMTPRADLRQQSPRDVLLAKCEFIDLDLQWRANQWASVGECPPGLALQSAAYRFGGFGTHENVIYYDLIRTLLQDCWDRVSQQETVEAAAEVERLEWLKDDWLHAPNDDFHGLSPAHIIEQERQRLPITLSPAAAVIDEDCPLCQMAGEEFGPMFWHLDGSHMDDDFPFSFFRTREEWEEEQRRRETFTREWEEKRAHAAFGDLPIWSRSYTDWEAWETLPLEEAMMVALIGIGGHVAELGLDLNDAPEGEALADSLRRDFADVKETVGQASYGLMSMSLDQLHEDLEAAAAAVPEVADKCADLQRRLERLRERLLA